MEINRASTLAKVLARDRALEARERKDAAIEEGRLSDNDAYPGSKNFQQAVGVIAQYLSDLVEAKISSIRDAYAQTDTPLTGETVDDAMQGMHTSLETVISARVGSWGGTLALVQQRTGQTVAGGAEALAEAERELRRQAARLYEKAEDLLIHMRFLPVESKHRDAGKEDIVQTFDPQKHHGANAARFFNYVNLCLGNRFRTMCSARMKNPLCRPGNLSLTSHWGEMESDQVDDEFCHAHSEHLRRRCQQQERQWDARRVLDEFSEFVKREDSTVLGAMEAIAATATPGAGAELLRITRRDFRRLSDRLRKLGQFFLNGETRLRRPTKPKPQYSHACEVSLCQAAQSSTAWNRVELYDEVWDHPLVKVSQKYGISDVRLGKVCRKLKIPHPGRGYWAKRAVGLTVEQVPLPEFKDAPVVRRIKTTNPAAPQGRHAKLARRNRARHEGRAVA